MASNKKFWIKKSYINIFFLAFFLYFLDINDVLADLNIKTWNQENIFTNYGQEITIVFEMKAENLEKNYYYYSWSFIFDKRQKINILEVASLDGKKINYTFGDNKLSIEFNKLFNQQSIKLKVRYSEINDEITTIPYIRRESIDIPAFSSGASAEITVKTLGNLDIYSLNENFKKVDVVNNIYKWSGTVKKSGFRDVFEMTKKEAKWKVSSSFKLTSDDNLKNITAEVPLNFVGGNNKIIKYEINTNQENNNKTLTNGELIFNENPYIKIDFKKFFSKEAIVKISTTIENNYNNFYWMNNFSNKDTTEINNEYINDYNTLINDILLKDKTNLPTHIKIAKWVHKNITYTDSYVGKHITSYEILQQKRGVCEHYAILYQDLLRSIGIPAKTISGVSYSFEKKKFENHAWVMVNYNSQWLPIDPTWGIYSGKLPISHIFVYNDIKNSVKFHYPNNLTNVKITLDNDVEFVE